MNTDNLKELVNQLEELHEAILAELNDINNHTDGLIDDDVFDMEASMSTALENLDEMIGRIDAHIETEFIDEDEE